MTRAERNALEWLLRHAPVRAVGDIDAVGLLALLKRGPTKEREERMLAHVLSGDLAQSRLEELVIAGAISALELKRLVRGLAAKGVLRKDGVRGHAARDWVSWVDNRRERWQSDGLDDRTQPSRRGRKAQDPEGRALTAAQRAKRYDNARRAEGLVRRTLWLSGEAAAALDELVARSGRDATGGAVASNAILAFHRVGKGRGE